MDSSTNADLISSWADTQQKLFADWTEMMRRLTGTQGNQVMSQTIDAWHQSLMQTLDAQATWIRNWTDSIVAAPDTSPAVRERTAEGREFLLGWIDTQRRLWQGWFDLLRNTSSSDRPEAFTSASQNMAKTWQDATQRLIELQSDWARQWTAAASASGRDRT